INVDVAIVVNVAGGRAHRAEIAGSLHDQLGAEFALALVDIQDAFAEFVDDIQVGPAVVVGIQPDSGEGGSAPAADAAARFGHVLEAPVAEVAPQFIGARLACAAAQPGAGTGLAWSQKIKV